MNTAKVAAALNTISLAFGELAEALSEGAAPVVAAPGATQTVTSNFPAQSVTLSMPEFPPSEYEDLPVAATPQNEPVLGRCPMHDLAWTIKPAGVSKLGKPYSAFWKCSGKDADGTYCNRKPVKAWADAHSAQLVAA